MKWLKRKFRNWLSEVPMEIDPSSCTSMRHESKSVIIRIYKAVGGTIIESQLIDPMNGKFNPSTLYIIRDGDNLGEEINKIITLQYLKIN
jgi:5S rRNA maturation endonuclease (ribonuclease M5)